MLQLNRAESADTLRGTKLSNPSYIFGFVFVPPNTQFYLSPFCTFSVTGRDVHRGMAFICFVPCSSPDLWTVLVPGTDWGQSILGAGKNGTWHLWSIQLTLASNTNTVLRISEAWALETRFESSFFSHLYMSIDYIWTKPWTVNMSWISVK